VICCSLTNFNVLVRLRACERNGEPSYNEDGGEVLTRLRRVDGFGMFFQYFAWRKNVTGMAEAPLVTEPGGRAIATQKPKGEITEPSILFARPGPDPTPVPKVIFVTRVGDLGCGVGYYK
jgi:hypothetical protein